MRLFSPKGPPSIFLLFCDRMDVRKSQRVPPFSFFRHCEIFFPKNFFHKRVPNSPILWHIEVLLLFLSLRYGADLGRSRLVYSMFWILLFQITTYNTKINENLVSVQNAGRKPAWQVSLGQKTVSKVRLDQSNRTGHHFQFLWKHRKNTCFEIRPLVKTCLVSFYCKFKRIHEKLLS